MNTVPTSILSESVAKASSEAVQMDAVSPYGESLIRVWASSSDETCAWFQLLDEGVLWGTYRVREEETDFHDADYGAECFLLRIKMV